MKLSARKATQNQLLGLLEETGVHDLESLQGLGMWDIMPKVLFKTGLWPFGRMLP